MYFLFSGEGATDFGTGTEGGQVCEGRHYEHGPMALMVDQIVNHEQQCHPMQSGCCGFVAKEDLGRTAKKLPVSQKAVRLPGKKRRQETGLFYRYARALALWAKVKADECAGEVVAVLFRDCDGSHSAGRGLWSDKHQSILDGFAAEHFETGVPMLPKPTSEAWLLCALKSRPYRNCAALEERSPSPKARKPLKAELSKVLNGDASRQALCALFHDSRVDASQIDMPSFNAFRERLLEVIGT